MTREEIVGLFHRRETAWRARDPAALAADHAIDGVVVSPTGGVLEGRAEIERIYRFWFTAFPDLLFTTEDLIIDGDRAALLARACGTHNGEFFGVAPTGRRIEVSLACLFRFEDGYIAHERRILDFTGVLIQVGVLRAKPAAAV
jgi:uncharacterized protein (TIGR02246 family)